MSGSLELPREVLVATRNPGKLRELRPLFADLGIAVVDLDEAGIAETTDEEAIEVYDTFEENALAKARYFARLGGGRPTVADDSGLEVQALDGRPGVRSRRFAGVDGARAAVDAANNARLVRELRTVADRRAQFVCAAAYVVGDVEVVARGVVAGVILDEAIGAGGFGYDPHFRSTELGRTFGEASRAEKAAVSHRARAFAGLVDRLRQLSHGSRGTLSD